MYWTTCPLSKYTNRTLLHTHLDFRFSTVLILLSLLSEFQQRFKSFTNWLVLLFWDKDFCSKWNGQAVESCVSVNEARDWDKTPILICSVSVFSSLGASLCERLFDWCGTSWRASGDHADSLNYTHARTRRGDTHTKTPTCVCACTICHCHCFMPQMVLSAGHIIFCLLILMSCYIADLQCRHFHTSFAFENIFHVYFNIR